MRFLFCSDGDRDAEERLSMMDAAWQEITPLLDDYSDVRAIERVVQRVEPCLETELLHERNGSRTLVITPREERHLRPLTDAFVERAPSLEGVRVTAHRPPRSHDEAIETIVNEHGFDLALGRARVGFSRGHLLEIVIYGHGFGGLADEAAGVAAERVVEALIGERLLDDWVGQVSAEPLARSGPLRLVNQDAAPTFALAELAGTLSSAAESLRGGLGELSRGAPLREGWALFEGKPESAPDYAEQDDVVLAASALPEMLKCYLEGAPFSSLRFTRSDNVFCYLKLDGSERSFEDRLADRVALEDRLAETLGPSGVVVGNGMGLRYAYIDLALSPDQSALDRVCDIARQAKVAERSWLLFCDSDWSDEWLGVWPKTPAPP